MQHIEGSKTREKDAYGLYSTCSVCISSQSKQTKGITLSTLVQELRQGRRWAGHSSTVSTHAFLLNFWQKFSLEIEFLVEYVSLLFITMFCVSNVMLQVACCNSLHYIPITLFFCEVCLSCECLQDFMSWNLSRMMCVSVIFACFLCLIFSNINNSVYILLILKNSQLWEMLKRWMGSVSLCVHICVQVHPPLHKCAEAKGWYWVSLTILLHLSFWDWVTHWIKSLQLVHCRLTASKLQVSSWFCLPSTGISDMFSHLAASCIWASELSSSCLYSKYFSYWAIFSILHFYFFCNSFLFLLEDYNYATLR